MVGMQYFFQLDPGVGRDDGLHDDDHHPRAHRVPRLPAQLRQEHRRPPASRADPVDPPPERRERQTCSSSRLLGVGHLVHRRRLPVPPLLPASVAGAARAGPASLPGLHRARRLAGPADWTRVADALVRCDAPAFDDLATWTGSVVRHPDGTLVPLLHGRRARRRRRQRADASGTPPPPTSMTWDQVADQPGARGRRALVRDAGRRGSGTTRRGVTRGCSPTRTATAGTCSSPPGRARVPPTTAVSSVTPGRPDLRTWELRPPLSEPGQGFGQLEVMQVEVVDGAPVLLFSCLATDMSAAGVATGSTGGVWATPAASLLGSVRRRRRPPGDGRHPLQRAAGAPPFRRPVGAARVPSHRPRGRLRRRRERPRAGALGRSADGRFGPREAARLTGRTGTRRGGRLPIGNPPRRGPRRGGRAGF